MFDNNSLDLGLEVDYLLIMPDQAIKHLYGDKSRQEILADRINELNAKELRQQERIMSFLHTVRFAWRQLFR